MRFPSSSSTSRESDRQTIALINIVFLILIFLMIIGSLRTFEDAGIVLPSAMEDETATVTDDRIVRVFADGRVSYRGVDVQPQEIAGMISAEAQTEETTLWVIADRAASANEMLGVVEELRRAHRGDVRLVVLRSDAT